MGERLGSALSWATNWLWPVGSRLLSLGLSFPRVPWERSRERNPPALDLETVSERWLVMVGG